MPTYTAILPAAGASRRMGQPKLLLPVDGTPMIVATLRALDQDGVVQRLVVGRPEDSALRRVVEAEGASWTTNPTPEVGMLESIRCAIRILDGMQAGILVCPADLPRLAPATVRRVLEAHAPPGITLVVPRYRDRRGHPLLIDNALVPAVSSLRRDQGLRQLTRDPAYPVHEVEVEDPGCLRDIDTPEEYAALIGGAP